MSQSYTFNYKKDEEKTHKTDPQTHSKFSKQNTPIQVDKTKQDKRVNKIDSEDDISAYKDNDNETDDEESSGSVSTDSPHSPDYSPPSSDVDEILGDGYSPPSQDLEDTHQTTSQGPPVNEEEKESVEEIPHGENSPPSQNVEDILPTTSQGPPVNEEEKDYLDVSSDNDSGQAIATNAKEQKNKISTTQNKESSEVTPKPGTNIKAVGKGKKKRVARDVFDPKEMDSVADTEETTEEKCSQCST